MRELLIIYNEICPFNIDVAHQVYHVLKNKIDIKINLTQVLNRLLVDKLFHLYAENSFKKIHEKYKKLDINIVTIFDDNYPNYLLHLNKPPVVLYIKGDMTLLKSSNRLALLSCNQYSVYTEKIIDEILCYKASVIVGTLVNSISQYIYEKVINYQRKCINILCTSFLDYYPRRTQFLQRKLEKEHVVITEIPLSQVNQVCCVTRARELIGAFSNAILLLEEDEHFYQLVTINTALNIGREIYVVPQHLFYKNGLVNNLLLKDGAQVYLNTEDILEC